MDVLWGSIDVKELLPTRDLDESSPLSAPDLRLLIDRLHVRSNRIKGKVRDYALSHRQDFAGVFSRCSAAAADAEELSASLSGSLGLISSRPIDIEIRDLAAEIQNKRRELEERREALAIVKTISRIWERLRSAREDLAAGRLVEAAEAVHGLRAVLSIEEDDDGEGRPVVFSLLRKEWEEIFDEMQGVLARYVESAVEFVPDDDGGVVVKCCWNVGEKKETELRQVLEAAEIIGGLDYGLAKLADSMVKYVLTPIVCDGLVDVSIEELNHDSLEKPHAVLTLFRSSERVDCVDIKTFYSRVIQSIEFICKFICLKKHPWVISFGKLTWSRLSDLIISHFLSKAVPDDSSKLASFEDTMKGTSDFETVLKNMGFISSIDSKEERLSYFVHNVEVHFASKKRKEILSRARAILLQFDSFSPETKSEASSVSVGVGNCCAELVDLLFHTEKCFVSSAALRLMDLVHETLKNVCLSSTRVAREFYHAARDALLLYNAIVPFKLEKQMENNGQLAIIVHNDCLYLAHEILGFAFEYRVDFPSGLKEQAVFVDIAPRFFKMSLEVLQKQAQKITSKLKEAIAGAHGFQNTHQPQEYEMAKLSVEQVVFILEKVRIMWEPILPGSFYKKTMCSLLESVFSEVTQDMLLLDDIAAEETLQLQRLIHLLLENLSPLLSSLITVNLEKEKFSNGSWSHLDEMLPPLRKIRKLADLFDMPLKSTTTAWEIGDLVRCGFTLSEVENFIEAIFADSQLRKDCLSRIRMTDTLIH